MVQIEEKPRWPPMGSDLVSNGSRRIIGDGDDLQQRGDTKAYMSSQLTHGNLLSSAETQYRHIMPMIEIKLHYKLQFTSGKQIRTLPCPTSWLRILYEPDSRRIRPATIAGCIRSFLARCSAASGERRFLAGLFFQSSLPIKASRASWSASCSRGSWLSFKSRLSKK